MLKEIKGVRATSQIPAEKLNFRVHLSLLDFFKTGNLGKACVGMERNELKDILGNPDEISGPIWWYGNIEFHFGEGQRVFLIYCDHIDRIGYDGKSINLDAWIFEEYRPPSKEQLVNALHNEGITYEHKELQLYGEFVLDSRVTVNYEYDDHQVSVISLYDDGYL